MATQRARTDTSAPSTKTQETPASAPITFPEALAPAPPALPRIGVRVNPVILAGNLKDGDRTTSVQYLQQQLHAAGHYRGQVDGLPGPLTLDAYRRFQPDGRVDADVLARLGFDVIT